MEVKGHVGLIAAFLGGLMAVTELLASLGNCYQSWWIYDDRRDLLFLPLLTSQRHKHMVGGGTNASICLSPTVWRVTLVISEWEWIFKPKNDFQFCCVVSHLLIFLLCHITSIMFSIIPFRISSVSIQSCDRLSYCTQGRFVLDTWLRGEKTPVQPFLNRPFVCMP